MHHTPALPARTHGLAAALVIVLTAAAPASAQKSVTVQNLDRPDRVLDRQFSLLRGFRELPDGRFVITDFTEDRVAVVDLTDGSVNEPNRTGPGPQEFRLPGMLHAFSGDSTLLLDAGNARIGVLDASGRIIRAFQPRPTPAASAGGVDRAGNLYFTTPAWMLENPLPDDTVELSALDLATGSIRSMARVHGYTPAPRPTGPQDGPRIPLVVFAKQDTWAVSPDGRVAIVRGGDYSVQWYENGRRAAAGPSYAFRTAKVTDADRVAYTRQFIEGSPVSGRGEGGSLGHNPASDLDPREIAATIRRSTFAELMPYFRPGDVRIDAAGRVWVGRMMPLGEPRRYDVFDRDGVMVAAFRLGPDRRLLGFGARHVYVVHTNDGDGLETIERLPMPAIGG